MDIYGTDRSACGTALGSGDLLEGEEMNPIHLCFFLVALSRNHTERKNISKVCRSP